LAFGGATPTTTGATEEYDGTSWANSPASMNTARQQLAGAGTQAAALAFGGHPPESVATEEYDGTSWTSNPTGLNTARRQLAGAGTQASALAAGGQDSTGVLAATEEWLGAGSPLTKTITVS
jgi:hypothetical protein